MGKSTISMAIFNSYFDITRGYPFFIFFWAQDFDAGLTKVEITTPLNWRPIYENVVWPFEVMLPSRTKPVQNGYPRIQCLTCIIIFPVEIGHFFSILRYTSDTSTSCFAKISPEFLLLETHVFPQDAADKAKLKQDAQDVRVELHNASTARAPPKPGNGSNGNAGRWFGSLQLGWESDIGVSTYIIYAYYIYIHICIIYSIIHDIFSYDTISLLVFL